MHPMSPRARVDFTARADKRQVSLEESTRHPTKSVVMLSEAKHLWSISVVDHLRI